MSKSITMDTTVVKTHKFQLSEKTKEWLAFFICLACLFLFLISAYHKIDDHGRFVKGLSKVAFIGTYSTLISWIVPIAEIGIAMLLIIPKTQQWGLYGFTGLMVVFTLYILSMLLWNEKLPCQCNLLIEKLSWTAHLWFNVVFIALAIFALWLMKKQQP